MRDRTSSRLTTLLVLCGLVLPGTAWAQLPADQTVSYWIHDDPNDPNSAVVFGVTLTLRADSRDDDSVAWEITEATFVEFDSYGEPIQTWEENFPHVYTADGLWWIDHADGGAPQLSEFEEPPFMEGTADAVDPGSADLDFALEGVPPNSGGPYAITAVLDHDFAVVGDPDPVQSGDDTPAQADDNDDPPTPV